MDIFTTFLDSYFLIFVPTYIDLDHCCILNIELSKSPEPAQTDLEYHSSEHHSTIAKVSAREATRDAPLFEEYAISYSAERLLGIARPK